MYTKNGEGYSNEDIDTSVAKVGKFTMKKSFKTFYQCEKGLGAFHSTGGSEREWPIYWTLLTGKYIRFALSRIF